MVKQAIKCMHCGSENIVRNGKRKNGVQCLLCRKCKKAFQQAYVSNGAKPEVKMMIIKMSLNGSGIRDISRVLEVSQGTVIAVLKKLKILLSTSIQNIVIMGNE